METRYLETLVKVAETGSFSKAAQDLHITQSAASQRIKFLEERYGKRLLDRSGPVLEPTPFGTLVLQKARKILELEKELQKELQLCGEAKRLALCCTPTFGTVYLPEVLNRFMLRNADVAEFQFLFNTPEQALKGLLSNEFDVAIVEHCDDLNFKDLETASLPRDELVFISASALDLPAPEIDLATLLKHRLYCRKDGCSSKKLLALNLMMQGKEIKDFAGVVISDDHRLTIQEVMAGEGVSFISRSLVAEQLERGSLRAHHVEKFCHFRNRTMIIHHRQDSAELLQNLAECVFAAMGLERPRA